MSHHGHGGHGDHGGHGGCGEFGDHGDGGEHSDHGDGGEQGHCVIVLFVVSMMREIYSGSRILICLFARNFIKVGAEGRARA